MYCHFSLVLCFIVLLHLAFFSTLTNIYEDNGVGDIRVENRCTNQNMHISFFQSGSEGGFDKLRHYSLQKSVPSSFGGICCLAPGDCMLYSRENLKGKESIDWFICFGPNKVPITTPVTHGFLDFKSQCIHMEVSEGRSFLHSFGFTDGPQPVLLITDDGVLARHLQQALHVRRENNGLNTQYVSTDDCVTMYLELRLPTVGLSLVDDHPRELLYLQLSGQPHWTWQDVGGVQKKFHLAEEDDIEVIHQKCLADASKGLTKSRKIRIHGGGAVDVTTQKYTPGGSDASLDMSRKFSPGLLLVYQVSKNTTTMRLVIEHVQLDNMNATAHVPVILSPTKLSPALRAKEYGKPWLYFECVRGVSPYLETNPIEIIEMMLVEFQEIDLSLSEDFLMSCSAFAQPSGMSTLDRVSVDNMTLQNMASVSRELFLDANVEGSMQKHFFQSFTLSSLKINISFSLSLAEVETEKEVSDAPDYVTSETYIKTILKAIGLAVTNLDHVPLFLGEFSIADSIFTTAALKSRIIHHYSTEGIRQIYKIFGSLDIIGNPIKVFNRIGAGLNDLFFEPFAADDKINAVGRGVKSLVSNTITGAGGALGSITGTLGNSMAVLSMDLAYQKERQVGNMEQHSGLAMVLPIIYIYVYVCLCVCVVCLCVLSN